MSETLLSETGHIRICRSGRLCHCGKKGCLEAYTGGWALIEQLNDPSIRSLSDLLSAVSSGHPEAIKVLREAAGMLGKHLCWPLQAAGAENVIIGGPLSAIFPVVWDAFIEGLSSVFDDKEIASMNPSASRDPQKALQTGAYLCARRLFFYPES